MESLVTINLLPLCSYFMVSPTFSSISDHADIQMHLEILNNNHNTGSSKKHNIPQSKFLHPEPIKWVEDSAARFRDGLNNNPISEMITHVKTTLRRQKERTYVVRLYVTY